MGGRAHEGWSNTRKREVGEGRENERGNERERARPREIERKEGGSGTREGLVCASLSVESIGGHWHQQIQSAHFESRRALHRDAHRASRALIVRTYVCTHTAYLIRV